MPRRLSEEEIRKIKAWEVFDVGTMYHRVGGFGRIPKQKRQDVDEDEK